MNLPLCRRSGDVQSVYPGVNARQSLLATLPCARRQQRCRVFPATDSAPRSVVACSARTSTRREFTQREEETRDNASHRSAKELEMKRKDDEPAQRLLPGTVPTMNTCCPVHRTMLRREAMIVQTGRTAFQPKPEAKRAWRRSCVAASKRACPSFVPLYR